MLILVIIAKFYLTALSLQHFHSSKTSFVVHECCPNTCTRHMGRRKNRLGRKAENKEYEKKKADIVFLMSLVITRVLLTLSPLAAVPRGRYD